MRKSLSVMCNDEDDLLPSFYQNKRKMEISEEQ